MKHLFEFEVAGTLYASDGDVIDFTQELSSSFDDKKIIKGELKKEQRFPGTVDIDGMKLYGSL